VGRVIGAIGGALLAVHLESAILARVFGVFYIGAACCSCRGASTPNSSRRRLFVNALTR